VLEDDFDGYGVHLYKIPVSDMPRTPSSERRP
jgi:hypothetical protein